MFVFLLFGTLLIGLLIIVFFKYVKQSRKGRLPPKIPTSLFTNISKLTAITTEPIDFLHDIAKDCPEAKTPYGELFRIAMPMPSDYIVSSDYKLVRLVMEGDTSIDLPEAEKTTIIRAFDYIDRPSILS